MQGEAIYIGREKFVWRIVVSIALLIAIFSPHRARAVNITAISPLSTSRYLHTATLLSSGKVLFAGGMCPGNITTNGAELLDPTTGISTPTGLMASARDDHTATLLPNGKVLVAGGLQGLTALSSCELYDPVTGTWSATGSLNTARLRHSATLLTNGFVLVAGGGFNGLSTSELYNPSTGVWTLTSGSMTTSRASHTATLLTNGLVLVAGGQQNVLPTTYLSSSELYNPATGAWSASGSMSFAHVSHSSTLLPDGTVLVAGGFNGTNALEVSEIYNPVGGTWAMTGFLSVAHEHHTATLEPDGTVMVTGGDTGTAATAINQVEFYNPTTRVWSKKGNGNGLALSVARTFHTATLIASGQTIIAGGENTASSATNTIDLYDFIVLTSAQTNSMAAVRRDQSATLLPNGKVLVAGGDDSSFVPISGAELFDPGTGNWSATTSLNHPRASQTATLLTNGLVLIAGGLGPNSIGTNSTELYNYSNQTWTVGPDMVSARSAHTATLLLTGKVLVAGGQTQNPLATAELFDPVAMTWSATGSMPHAHARHEAVLLPSGKVLVAGGVTDSTFTSSATAELYDPVAATWSSLSSMNTAREYFTATLLPNGQVLAAGGLDPTITILSSAELYNPASGLWTATGSLNAARDNQEAVLLLEGKVLVSGGLGTGDATLSSDEVYDPLTKVWGGGGSMIFARYQHTATLITNGQVLLAGGSPGTGSQSTAELLQVGAVITNSWRPRITSFSSPLGLGTDIVLGGAQFHGISQASGGNNSQDSPANNPVVQLRSLENGITTVVYSTNWSATSFSSVPVTNFPNGYALATLVANGIPSFSQILVVGLVPATVTLGNLSQPFDGTTKSVSVLTSPPGLSTSVTYNGSGTPPYDSGSYAVVATVTAPGYVGGTNGTLVITPFSSVRQHGVDVSHFQGSSGVPLSSWNQMVSNGQFFAFVKASEGLTGPDDPTMSVNLANARAAGMLAGVYHFAHPENRPTTNGAIQEADHFLSYAGSAIGPGYLRPALDVETIGATQTIDQLTQWVIAFSNEIQAKRGANAAPVLYCFINNYDSNAANINLWIPVPAVGNPATNNPATGVFNNWSFWQYTTASSGGIASVDFDICHDDFEPIDSFIIPPIAAGPISIGATMSLPNGTFQLTFTNTPGAGFSVLTATNAALPLANWTLLGPAAEISSGQFRFTDSQATNYPARFYRVRSP